MIKFLIFLNSVYINKIMIKKDSWELLKNLNYNKNTSVKNKHMILKNKSLYNVVD